MTDLRLEVTSGQVGYCVTEPSVRAVVPGTQPDGAILSFVYQGPTELRSALGSGQIRHQVAIKLHAMDGDNVLYCAWRWLPDGPRIQVQTKLDGEYHQPTQVYVARPVGSPVVGRRYALEAHVSGVVARVWIDGEIVWVGAVHPPPPHGLAGFRTDNAALADVGLAPRGA